MRDLLLTPSWWFSTVIVALAVNLFSTWLYEKLKSLSDRGVVSKWILWLSIAHAVVAMSFSVALAWRFWPVGSSEPFWAGLAAFLVYVWPGIIVAIFVMIMLRSPRWSLLALLATLGVLTVATIDTHTWVTWEKPVLDYLLSAMIATGVAGFGFTAFAPDCEHL